MAVPFARLKAALAERYDLERELGRGGMATVYLARDLKHHRWVAVKVLLPEVSLQLGAKRFQREIEICARLAHPHILPLHDSGEAEGLLYYVSPWLEGETLQDRLRRERQLPLEDALGITREVAEALGHAHAHDIVHRDIKPGNIFLSGGHAIVLDFGLARAMTAAGGERLTQTGFVIGTPDYMSPEQARGAPEVDGRSDLFSLGCVLYEMLAGHPPFAARSAHASLAKRLKEPPPPLRSLRDAIPIGVEAVVFKALARNPADRFPTTERFLEALDRATDPVSIGAPGVASGASRLGRAVSGTTRMPSFLEELRRREVFDTGVWYAAIAWILVQVAETTFPVLGLPLWTVRVVIWAALVGFPLALGLSWMYEVTRDGVRRTQPIKLAGEAAAVRKPWVRIGTLTGAALALAAFGWWWLARR